MFYAYFVFGTLTSGDAREAELNAMERRCLELTLTVRGTPRLIYLFEAHVIAPLIPGMTHLGPNNGGQIILQISTGVADGQDVER